MDDDNLPSKVLREIFRNLSGNEVLLCRKVCQRWDRAVDSLEEIFWQKLCEKEYPGIYEEAFRKASLTWIELYKSLSLWAKVSDADVTIKEIPNGWTGTFEVLKDGVIACPQNYKKCHIDESFPYNAVVYYKLGTLEESHRECFNFTFFKYTESDNILLLQYPTCPGAKTERAKVLLKENKELYTLSPKSINARLFLFHDKIYWCKNKQIMVAEIVEKNGNYTLETKHVPDTISSDVVTITKVNKADRLWRKFATEKTVNDQVHILTDDGTVYSLVDTVLIKICWRAHPEDEFSYFEMLKLCAMEWSNPKVLKYYQNQCRLQFETDFNRLFYYGNILIMTIRFTSLIHIFYGIEDNGEISINEEEPDKIIDLSKHEDGVPYLYLTDIMHIDFVEVENGHKIIVLFCGKILVIELSHNNFK